MTTRQKEVLDLVWQQTGVYFEPLKPKEFRAKLNEWRKKWSQKLHHLKELN